MSQEFYTPTYCANHPDRETSLRCKRCEKPICDKCAVLTPVGYVCRDCMRNQQKTFDTAEWYDFPLAMIVAAGLSYLGSIVAGFMGFFTIFIAPVFGVMIAEAVRRVIRRRRSRLLFRLVAVAAAVGALPRVAMFLFTLLVGMNYGSQFAAPALIGLLWPAVYAFLVTSTVYYRISGIQIR